MVTLLQGVCSGYQEGGPSLLSLFNGLVTDTSAQYQHLVTILLSSNHSCLPSSLDYGFLDRLEVTNLGISLCIFLKILEAMGLARGTFAEFKVRREAV